VTLLYA